MKVSKEIKKEKYEAPKSVSYELDCESLICTSQSEETGTGDDFINGSGHGGGTNPWDN